MYAQGSYMTDFVRGVNPIWSLVDLVGQQLDDTCWMYVLENTVPYQPAPVYETSSGTPMANPINFDANGTLPVDMYFDPDIVYRLEIRRNDGLNPPSQADELLYLVQNYIPTGQTVEIGELGDDLTENQITNSQFSLMHLNGTYTLAAVTNPPELEVAPGWFLSLVGTGSVTIERIPLNNANANPTNAPYALRINTTGGWTSSPVLRQRLQQNGMLWANKFVSTSITARIEGASQNITARLDASDGMGLGVLLTATLDNDFDEYKGFFELNDSVNADLPPAAYVDFKILLPTTGDVYLTSIQLLASQSGVAFDYEEDTINRQLDHSFNYFKPLLEAKPLESFLIGWDFRTNPAQFGEAVSLGAIGANKSAYVWDQTIVFQSVNNSIASSRAASNGLTLTATGATQPAIIQYLEAEQARQILSGNVSLALKGSCSAASQVATVSLWATNDPNLPDVSNGTNNSIVGSLNADGTINTTNGNWTQLDQRNPGNVQFTLTPDSTEFCYSYFKDNTATPRVSDATYFAIVISFDSLANAQTVTLDWVTLVPGDIPTGPTAKAKEQVIQECQRYYEKSYTSATAVGTDTLVNALVYPQKTTDITGGNCYPIGASFTINLKNVKSSLTPNVRLWSKSGTVDNVQLRTVGAGNNENNVPITKWTQTVGNKIINYSIANPQFGNAGNNYLRFATATANPQDTGAAMIRLHYEVDSRLGIV